MAGSARRSSVLGGFLKVMYIFW